MSNDPIDLLNELQNQDYVVIAWCANDVSTLRPDWTDEQCKTALANVAKYLKERSIELGWEVLDNLLLYNYGSAGPHT